MDYAAHLFVVVLIYAILALSLELVVGRVGLLSVSHAAFYGIGAYASAVLTAGYDCSFLCGVGLGIIVSVATSLVISLPSVRLRGDYFIIATLAFQVIGYSVFNNWTAVTRGPLGIAGIPAPIIIGWHVDTQAEFAILALLGLSLCWFVVWRVVASPFGRVLLAIREDERLAQSLGKATLGAKIAACALGAALASIAGSIYAHFTSYIDPTTFTVGESILILSMVIIGGAGSMWGALLGAFVLVTLPEALRFVGLPILVAANLRQMIYGALLVLMMLMRPQGLVGRYAFAK